MNRLHLGTAYWAPISYFTAMYRHGGAVVEQHDTYIKQTYRNRCNIVGAQGVQTLTIPVEKPSPHTIMRDVRISDHGNWRHLHRTAIASAYGSSPFYEYYADDINRLYEKQYQYLVDYNCAQIECVCNWLNIHLDISLSENYLPQGTALDTDLREAIHPKHPDTKAIEPYLPRPYYQVFASRYGFIQDVSILDLLCNMGNESLLILAGVR